MQKYHAIVNSKKCTRLEGLLQILDDPKYPSVGPHLRLLGFIGLWNIEYKSIEAYFKRLLFLITVCFFISQYVKCIVKLDVTSLRLILQYAPFHMGIVKSCFFQSDYTVWKDLLNYTATVEGRQLAKKDNKLERIIRKYVSRNRKVTYFFWALAFFSNFSIFSEPYQKNQTYENGTGIYVHIFDGYTPFGETPPGYYVSMTIQTVLGHVVSAYVVGWDTLVVSLMIFFAGQLKISRLYCTRMISGKSSESHRNISECHEFHTSLIKYQKIFNSLISPVMFVYLIVISVNLGVCIIQIAEIKDDLPALVSSCVFVMACLIQLLLFYWHSNEVTMESTTVSYSTFQSNWTISDKNIQKEVALLGLTTNKTMVFKAGPFNKMSLTTFVAILRASYSFYTLLNETR